MEQEDEEYFNVRMPIGPIGTTPLHISISDGSDDVALELIHKGANINAQDIFGNTPLHIAIANESHEMMCMLLCYGADVTIVDEWSRTPLILALITGATESASTLIGYYDDFSQMDDRICNALSVDNRQLTLDLLNAGAFENCVCLSLFEHSIIWEDAEIFTYLWSVGFPEVLYNDDEPFIFTYVLHCNFNSSEWLECLYLILTSPFVSKLVDHFNVYIDYRFDGKEAWFFHFLMVRFADRYILPDDRMKILSLCLSLGITSDFMGLEATYFNYGFEEELNILIYAGDVYPSKYLPRPHIDFMVCHILGIELPNIRQLFEDVNNFVFIPCPKKFNVLEFFAVDCETKDMLTELIPERNIRITPAQLANAPTFPSLLELCRTWVRNLIKTKTCDIPYKFHEKINSLELPPVLTDILLFKGPIYFLD